MQPFRFHPYLRPMIWGGRHLATYLHKLLPDDQPYGESWEVSDHSMHHSVIDGGPFDGWTLRQLMEQKGAALLGTDDETFPWLIKFLDANDWLSVQVHPDEDAVKTLWPGEGSKTEAWFILHTEPDSKIHAGLRQGVDESVLREALKKGTVAECLHSFSPQPGDCVFLPAGTVHALGGGIVLAELQQTSDATFRLFDWNRIDAHGKSRTLHIDEAMASIHWEQGAVAPVRVENFASATPGVRRQPLVQCDYFQMEYVEQSASFSWRDERLQALIVLGGEARLLNDAGEDVLQPGQVWILPATCGMLTCESAHHVAMILCRLPSTYGET